MQFHFNNDGVIFLVFVLVGIIISIIYDFFRAFRKVNNSNDFSTYIQDILFWLITGFILIFSIFNFNYGSIRGYVLLGIGTGGIVYFLTISKFFVIIFKKLIVFVKFLYINFILRPFKYILRLVLKPVTFICINLKNINKVVSKNIINKINLVKNCKNKPKKKDFTKKSRI